MQLSDSFVDTVPRSDGDGVDFAPEAATAFGVSPDQIVKDLVGFPHRILAQRGE